jgi:hypothetical protein
MLDSWRAKRAMETPMTKEEFDELKRPRESSLGNSYTPSADPIRGEVLRLVTRHLPKAVALLGQALDAGDVHAAMMLTELWSWARESR